MYNYFQLYIFNYQLISGFLPLENKLSIRSIRLEVVLSFSRKISAETLD